MISAQTVATNVAERIKQADNDAANASAAFVSGRFEEYWKLKSDQLMKRLESEGEQSITNAGDGGESG